MKKFFLPALATLLLAACGAGEPPCTDNSPACQARNEMSTSEGEGGICSLATQKRWVHGHLDNVYLWHNEINEVPETNYSTAPDYFKALLVSSKDRFSFSQPQAQFDSFFQEGVEIGYGFNYQGSGGHLYISYIDPDSPADFASIKRGAEILSIDAVPISKMTSKSLTAALQPTSTDQRYLFEIRDRGAEQSRSVTLTSRKVRKFPTQNVNTFSDTYGRTYGYMQFNAHTTRSEVELILNVLKFQKNQVQDVIVDMRYNRGGYLYIAAETAQMLSGPQTQGKVFEKLIYNDKHPEKTAAPSSTVLFPAMTRDQTYVLPQMNLPRVFLLTGPDTCSASEAIINGLTPFMQVILIGDKTCGKPYGFSQANQCGNAYFAIEFQGFNSLGKSDYANGIEPTCYATDDLQHDLGDPKEARLAAALHYAQTGTCGTARARQHSPALTTQNPPYLDQSWRNQRLLK
ncbi:MAG: PDZ domain-containing protein [Burkholderiales bacterium]|nr:PDZ domain-containing protein [Burkholderiales bacterium]